MPTRTSPAVWNLMALMGLALLATAGGLIGAYVWVGVHGHSDLERDIDKLEDAAADLNDSLVEVNDSMIRPGQLCGLAEDNVALDCLSDVNTSGVDPGDILRFNGTTWEPEECNPCINGTDGAPGINGTDGADGGDGDDGLHCWDINGNGLCDLPVEDINDDGVCNQTDCLGDPGMDGVDGTNATIEGCEKPFASMVWAEGSVSDNVYLEIPVTTPGTWIPIMDSLCRVVDFRNLTYLGNCTWEIEINQTYQWDADISFTTSGSGMPEIGLGVCIDMTPPIDDHQASMHGTLTGNIDFETSVYLTAGQRIGIAVTNVDNNETIQIESMHFDLIGNLICSVLETGPRGERGVQGPQGDDGFSCWDLNQNYFCDLPGEDINGDGFCSVADCTLADITYDNITGDVCPVLDAASIDCLGDVVINQTSLVSTHVLRADPSNPTQFINGPLDFCELDNVVCPSTKKRALEIKNFYTYNVDDDEFRPTPITYEDIEDVNGTSMCASVTQNNVSIDCLIDVNASTPTSGSFLKGNGVEWVPGGVSYAELSGDLCTELAGESLDCLTDVSVVGPVAGEYLGYNGTDWVNAQVEYADLGGSLCTELGGESLDCLSDVDAAAPSNGDVLVYNSTSGLWEPGTVGGGSTPVFGTEFQQVSDESTSGTSSTTYQQKLRLTTPSLPAGTYRVGWYAELRIISTAANGLFRVQQDDSTTVAEVRIESDDTGDFYPMAGFRYEALSGVVFYDIDWARQNSAATIQIRRARLEIWRVA